MTTGTKRRPKRRPTRKEKGRWLNRARKVANGGRRVKGWAGAPKRALNNRFGYRYCSRCGQRHPLGEWANYQKAHDVEDRGKTHYGAPNHPHTQQGPRPARKPSKTVAGEKKKRGDKVDTTKKPTRKQTAQQKARKRWGQESKKKGENVANNGGGQAGGGGATQAAAYIQAAAKCLIDFEPTHHSEMKDLAFSMNQALGALGAATEAFHQNRVNQRFHPRVLVSLNTVAAALVDSRSGWIQMINAIERHYQAYFEAARQAGPVPGQDGKPNYFDESKAS